MLQYTPFLEEFKVSILDLNTNKAELFKLVLELSLKKPEICDRIELELNEYALQKKQMRLADKKYQSSNQPSLIDLSNIEETNTELKLEQGRPRALPNEFYLFLLVLRGCYGSISNKEVVELMNDSVTMKYIMKYYNCSKFAVNTIRENLNVISKNTAEFIFKCQVEMIFEESLDDFTEVLIDSTSVKANSEYPTDVTVLYKLLNRINKSLENLSKFGISNFEVGNSKELLKEINSLVTNISLSFGSNNNKVKKKRKENSLALFEKAKELINHCLDQQNKLQIDWENINLLPSKIFALDILWGKIEQDLEDVQFVFNYAYQLLLGENKTPNKDKLLSIADPDVGYIKKGSRAAVIGYKPQIARSGNGFICGYMTPKGNASDSGALIPMLEQVIENTYTIPAIVSVDDGYSSQENYDNAKKLGIHTVSISGAKGKRITEEDWDLTLNIYARNKRSAVESGMFTLKYNHNFGRLARRGIEAVNAEQLEKIIAYNFQHIIRTRNKNLMASVA